LDFTRLLAASVVLDILKKHPPFHMFRYSSLKVRSDSYLGEGAGLSKQALTRYMKRPLTKVEVGKLLDACKSPGAKLAVALAAHSGLGPGQLKKLVFRNLMEFSLAKKQFVGVPSRIQMLEAVGNQRTTVVRYYTFLSTQGCEWLLEDLKSRPQPRGESTVVTEEAFKLAEKTVHAAGLRWHELRDFFHSCCVLVNMPRAAVNFMLGHVLCREDRFDRIGLSQEVDYMRKKYAKVEEHFSV
jgi:hypothetical protein